MTIKMHRTAFAKQLRFCLLAASAVILIAGPIHADSGLRLPYPTEFGVIPAQTFDEGQHRVGDATLSIERLDDGNILMTAETAVDGGPRTLASAVLAPINDEEFLQPITQESRSFDGDGNPIGVLTIDHRAGEAICVRPDPDSGAMNFEQIELPANDHVVNVPLNLLFDPLVKGETKTVDFQILLCRESARLMNFKASVARRSDGADGHDSLVEIRYVPDQGKIFSFFARAVIPKLSFWFDPASPKNWLAHRMPLYSNGPEVYVVRQGVTATSLLD